MDLISKLYDKYVAPVTNPEQGVRSMQFAAKPKSDSLFSQLVYNADKKQLFPQSPYWGYDAATKEQNPQKKQELMTKASIHMALAGMADGVKSVGDEVLQAGKALYPTFNDSGDLTLRTFQKLEGTKGVSKEHIANLLKTPDIKQAERNILQGVLDTYPQGQRVPVSEYAQKARDELLPLNRGTIYPPKWEEVNLPKKFRNNVTKYSEHIYESPIKTTAGQVHFRGDTENYFGHVRTEDLGDTNPIDYAKVKEIAKNYSARIKSDGTSVNGNNIWQLLDENGNIVSEKSSEKYSPFTMQDAEESALGKFKNKGGTRRIIELQSDLMQKGRLERDLGSGLSGMTRQEISNILPKKEAQEYMSLMQTNQVSGLSDSQIMRISDLESQARNLYVQNRKAEIAPLQPYKNSDVWMPRMVREEVKQAARDGKDFLQFPTGETAMNIEGLGSDKGNWMVHDAPGDYSDIGVLTDSPIRMRAGNHLSNYGVDYVLTKSIGDGKFRAISTFTADNNYEIYKKIIQKRADINGDTPSLSEITDLSPQELKLLDDHAEQFDISGKVDTNNPIYKFYEKDIGKYLKNKYKAEKHTDENGVTWWRLKVPKEAANKPVEAFGVAGAVGAGTAASIIHDRYNKEMQQKTQY